MRQGTLIWLLGFVVSVVVHLGAGAGLMAALQPEPIGDQPTPESRLNVEAQEVRRSDATERAAPSDRATEADAGGTALGVGAIAQSKAAAIAAPIEPANARDAMEVATTAPVAEIATPKLAEVAPKARAAPSPQLTAQVTQSVTPQTTTASLTQPNAETLKPDVVPAAAASFKAPDAATATPQAPDAPQTAALPPASDAAPAMAPERTASRQQTPQVTSGRARLAFPAEGSIDPVSLAAFQSFMDEGSAEGTDVRDSVSAALSLPCSRMQVIFDPDTTTLRLTGHVPDASQRAPVVAALQAQMGADIAVADNLLVLPAPQCGALSGIASVGLPQSTNQITDARIIGSDTHARAFRYVKDQPLVIDMTGPDYPAYVYLDYFDADGNVIHLTPNERAPLQRVPAKGPISFGARSAQEPGLFVRIGPPYGQEIAAAFAASVPIYDGLRPLVEPADAYLAWLKDRVADARATHPDFKGEWVYFFVTTAAK